MINDKIRAFKSGPLRFFLIKENVGVIFGIALISTNQRPVFIHCAERFQTILII